MATFLEILWKSFIFFAPAFFANAVPVFTSGLGRIDRGKTLKRDGKPILGAHKTIGGALGGLLGSLMVGFGVPMFFPEVFLGESPWGYQIFSLFISYFGLYKMMYLIVRRFLP